MVFSRTGRFCLGIFLLAFTLRLIYINGGDSHRQDPDEEVYLTIARNFQAGRGLILSPYRRASFPPLYPLFLSGVFTLGFDSHQSVQIIQAMIGSLTCFWVMGITRLTFTSFPDPDKRRTAIVAGLLTAVYPPLIFYAARLLTETLFIFLLLGGIYCYLKQQESRGDKLWSGVSSGLFSFGVLCRPTLFPVVLIAPLWLVISGRKRALISVLIFLAVFFLTLFPWQWRNYRLFKRFIPVTTQAGNILYLANNPEAKGGPVSIKDFLDSGVYHLGNEEDELIYNQFYREKAQRFIRDNPLRFLSLSLQRLAWFYHLDFHSRFIGLTFAIWALILLGLIGVYRSRSDWKNTGFLLLIILNFTSIHMIFPPEGRYRLPIMPILFSFAAIPIAAAAGWVLKLVVAKTSLFGKVRD